jgi:HEPN domain-containing protein
MAIKDTEEWFEIANEDLDVAKILNNAYRRHLETICYHSAQSAEKLLKGFIIYHNIIPPKIHDLTRLHQMCVNIDIRFKTLKKECKFLNLYTNEIRYPSRVEVAETDADYAIKFVEKIIDSEPIKELIELIDQCKPYGDISPLLTPHS